MTKDETRCAPTRDTFLQSATTAELVKGGGGLIKTAFNSWLEAKLGTGLKAALEQNFEETVSAFTTTLDTDTKNMQSVTTNLKAVFNCRKGLAADINRAVRARTTSRADAEVQMATLRKLMDEDAVRAQKILGEAAARSDELRVATQEARKTADSGAQTRKVAEAEKSLQTNQQVYESSEKDVKDIQVAANEGDDFDIDDGVAWLIDRLRQVLFA